MSLFLLTGQFSARNTAAVRLSFSCSSSLQSHKKCMYVSMCVRRYVCIYVCKHVCMYVSNIAIYSIYQPTTGDMLNKKCTL